MWVKYLRKEKRKLSPAGNQFDKIRKKEKKKKQEKGSMEEGETDFIFFLFFCFFIRFTKIGPSDFFGPKSKVFYAESATCGLRF